MDDFGFIIYIILAIVGILSQAGKAKKKKKSRPVSNPQPRPRANNPENESPEGGLTFEELLKEFTQQKQPETTQTKVEVNEPDKSEWVDDDEIKANYQRSVEEAKSISSSSDLRTSIDDRHTGEFDHFDQYDDFEEPEEESEIVKMLKSEDGPRKAVILSEIFNRKY